MLCSGQTLQCHELMNHKGIYGKAPATPGLFMIMKKIIVLGSTLFMWAQCFSGV